MDSKRVIVIGAGMGGLASGAALARLGHSVTVLEAHIYPGGVAGTFYHQGYRFDAGATLAAGFYPGGPMDLLGRAVGVDVWPVEPLEPAMLVHLPNRAPIARWSGDRRWGERLAAFGRQSFPFWEWQERTADQMWSMALQLPPWPPQTASELRRLASIGGATVLSHPNATLFDRLKMIPDAMGSVSSHLPRNQPALQMFVDAQLLISAQATSSHANALYGAAALDLPRRGVAQPLGGMGQLSETLVQALERRGGQVLYRHRADRIVVEGGRPLAVATDRNGTIPADIVIANVPAWNLSQMLGEHAPYLMRRQPRYPKDGWGALTVYVGLDESALRKHQSLHHQVVTGNGWGDGDSVYLSISPASDNRRSPQGKRALTLSTHTRMEPWEELLSTDLGQYRKYRDRLVRKMLQTAEAAVPELHESAELLVPGTPAAYERFTGRPGGWVGGYPQTSLFRARGARISQGIWMVGDSIFPGQSIAATALGGLRVSRAISEEIVREDRSHRLWVGRPASSVTPMEVE